MKKLYILLVAILATISANAQTYNDGQWYSVFDTKEKTNVVIGSKIVEYKNVVGPTAQELSLEYKRLSFLSTKGFVEVLESNDGGKNLASKGKELYDDTKNYSTLTCELSADINYIKINNTANGAGGDGVKVKNIKVPLAAHIRLDNDDDFGL